MRYKSGQRMTIFNRFRVLMITMLIFTFIGCDVDSKLSNVSDRDMRMKIQECKTANSPAPAMIFACENYQRECKKRNDKAGYFVC